MIKEVLKIALDDLIAEYCMEASSFAKRVDEIFKQALAAPVQKPVAWRVQVPGYADNYYNAGKPSDKDIAYWRGQGVELELAYGTPPAAQPAVPLTDEQIAAIGKELGLKCRLGGNPNIDFDYARAIEAAHQIGVKK